MVSIMNHVDQRAVLAKAVVRAGQALGFTQDQTAKILGRNRSVFTRGIDPDDKAGELALLLIRAYRSLFVLVGQEGEPMRPRGGKPGPGRHNEPRG
jgi:hypothetical protein